MLGLKLPSDPRWVGIAKKNIQEILTDHAYCEQKAASYAISLIIGFPEKKDLVLAMINLAQEEMSHFKMVYEIILKNGKTRILLGSQRLEEKMKYLNSFQEALKEEKILTDFKYIDLRYNNQVIVKET